MLDLSTEPESIVKINNILKAAQAFINSRTDHAEIAVEVLPLSNYVRSAEIHQDRLDKFPEDYCHIPNEIMQKYK